MSRNFPDDPRLTAYALGELSESDRAAVEQQIGESVETLLEIEAIREAAGQLRAALREETPTSAFPTLARSASEGIVALRVDEHSRAETPSLALRASMGPGTNPA